MTDDLRQRIADTLLRRAALRRSFWRAYRMSRYWRQRAETAERALAALNGPADEEPYDEANDHTYRDMVNAPLRPETIAALNKRLAAGDVPVIKVESRGGPAAACPTECDDDCDAACHEGHHVPWKRHHEVDSCLDGPAAEEQAGAALACVSSHCVGGEHVYMRSTDADGADE